MGGVESISLSYLSNPYHIHIDIHQLCCKCWFYEMLYLQWWYSGFRYTMRISSLPSIGFTSHQNITFEISNQKTFFFHSTFEKYTSLQFKLSVQHPIEVMIFMTQTWSQKSSRLDILHKSCNMDYSFPLDMIAQRCFVTGKRYPQDRLFCAVYE